jgi:hypothetical protein
MVVACPKREQTIPKTGLKDGFVYVVYDFLPCAFPESSYLGIGLLTCLDHLLPSISLIN